jgi:hypothetical protein
VANRFMLLTTLFAGLLLALFADRARDWATAPRLVALAMIVAAFLAIAPRVPRGGVQVQVPAFFTGRDAQHIPEGGVALLAPYPSPRNVSPMSWQAMADLRFRMPGGYFVGPDPSGRPRYGSNPRRLSGVMTKIQSGWRAPKLGPGLRAELAGDLAHWRVGTVVVGPTRNQATMVQFFTELLGRGPSPVGGVWVWWDVRPGEPLAADPDR